MTTSADKKLIQHDAAKTGKATDPAAVFIGDVTGQDVTVRDDTVRDDTVRDDAEQPDVPFSDSERLQMQQDRLDAIRRAVESGAYDSEELLEKSIRLMMDRIDAEPDLQ